MVEPSQSEDDRKMKATEEIEKENAGEEVKKEKHCSSIVRRWWSNAKNKGENLNLDDDFFHRKTDAKIDNAKNSGETESEWQIVRSRRKTKDDDRHAVNEVSLKEHDSSVSLISEDSECQFVVRTKRQRTDGMKIDARRRQEHQKENKIVTHKNDEDTKGRQKAWRKRYVWSLGTSTNHQHSMTFCVTWLIVRPMSLCFRRPHNWHEDGTAEELGWNLMKEGKTAIAVRKKNSRFLQYRCRNTRWILFVLGSILFLSMYLPHTWGGEAHLEEYYKTLKGIDENLHEVKQKYNTSGIIAGMDAQVEVKPQQGPFVGSDT